MAGCIVIYLLTNFMLDISIISKFFPMINNTEMNIHIFNIHPQFRFLPLDKSVGMLIMSRGMNIFKNFNLYLIHIN